MKKLLPLIFICAAIIFAGGCGGRNKSGNEPYARSARKAYESKIYYSVLIPFLYENSFYSYYALGKKIDGPDKKGFFTAQFKNGPKKGEQIRTKNILLKVRAADASDLRKGMVVLVNHWDPRTFNESTPVDIWRKGVVYNLEKLGDGLVMLEFPHDRNDFLATKEVYSLDNVWLILDPPQKDPRIFL